MMKKNVQRLMNFLPGTVVRIASVGLLILLSPSAKAASTIPQTNAMQRAGQMAQEHMDRQRGVCKQEAGKDFTWCVPIRLHKFERTVTGFQLRCFAARFHGKANNVDATNPQNEAANLARNAQGFPYDSDFDPMIDILAQATTKVIPINKGSYAETIALSANVGPDKDPASAKVWECAMKFNCSGNTCADAKQENAVKEGRY